jgi:hypothetical protein
MLSPVNTLLFLDVVLATSHSVELTLTSLTTTTTLTHCCVTMADQSTDRESRRKRVSRALLQRPPQASAVRAPDNAAEGNMGGRGVEAIRLAEEHTERTVGAVRLADTSITMLKLAWPIARHGKGAAMQIESQLHEVCVWAQHSRALHARVRTHARTHARTHTRRSPSQLRSGLPAHSLSSPLRCRM